MEHTRLISLTRLFRAPAEAVMGALFYLPLIVIFGYSFLTRGAYGGASRPLTIEAYSRVFDPLYLEILFRSVWIAIASTAICLVAAFPLAFYIARFARSKTLMINLVTLPFWTSFLIRTYAWMFLLRDTGLVNIVLERVGLISGPLPLLFNNGAVILGLVYGYLPFMVLPIYASLEKLDPALLDAAEDLGANPWMAAWHVAVPLAKSGIWAGSLLVFIPCLGAYLTPDLMGGGKTVMLGNLVQNQFTSARDWPFGAAISLVFMGAVFITMRLLRRHAEDAF